MEKYNRDLYTKGLESYEVPQYEPGYKPLDFVFGFVAGAILGSALGLILKPSAVQKKRTVTPSETDGPSHQLKEEAIKKADALKAQARRMSEAAHPQENTEQVSAAERAAQQRAIRSEVDSDRLQGQTARDNDADKQQVATATTQAVTATGIANAAKDKQEKDKAVETKTETPDNDAVAAQQRAIRSEVDGDRLQDPSAKSASQSVNDKGQESKDKNDSQKEAQTETSSTPHRQAKFENGVITHDQASTQEDSTSQKDFEFSEHRHQVAEEAKKTNSKVEKHTFND